MKRTFFASLLALVSALSIAAVASNAQTARKGNTTGAQSQPTANTRPATGAQTSAAARRSTPLPASDAVMNVNMRALLTEAIPRALGNDAAKLAAVNADIEQFKTRTGLDARAFDTLAVGVRFTNPSPDVTKIDHIVAIARGTFNPAALVAAGRIASKGKYVEQQHGGKAVHVFTLDDQVKLFGLFKARVRDMAISVLDANTLAIGEPEAVRAAIDAQAGRGRVDAAMLDLAGSQTDVIGFASNVPPSAVKDLDVGMPDVTRGIASIRRFYGGIGMAGAGFQMLTVLQTTSAADARSLGQTIESIRQIAPGLLSMSGGRGKLAVKAIESLKVTAQGSDVQLRLELSPDYTAVIRNTL